MLDPLFDFDEFSHKKPMERNHNSYYMIVENTSDIEEKSVDIFPIYALPSSKLYSEIKIALMYNGRYNY